MSWGRDQLFWSKPGIECRSGCRQSPRVVPRRKLLRDFPNELRHPKALSFSLLSVRYPDGGRLVPFHRPALPSHGPEPVPVRTDQGNVLPDSSYRESGPVALFGPLGTGSRNRIRQLSDPDPAPLSLPACALVCSFEAIPDSGLLCDLRNHDDLYLHRLHQPLGAVPIPLSRERSWGAT